MALCSSTLELVKRARSCSRAKTDFHECFFSCFSSEILDNEQLPTVHAALVQRYWTMNSSLLESIICRRKGRAEEATESSSPSATEDYRIVITIILERECAQIVSFCFAVGYSRPSYGPRSNIFVKRSFAPPPFSSKSQLANS
jgi:hypothetical protein